jgi:hypothetical protein
MRLHQVIRENCRIILSSLDMQNHGLWKFQKADSESKIIESAIEITATVPQLAGYLEQLELRRLTKGLLSVESLEQPRLEKITGPGTMEYTSHFGNAPSPFRRGDTPTSPQSTSQLAPRPAPQPTPKSTTHPIPHHKPSTMSTPTATTQKPTPTSQPDLPHPLVVPNPPASTTCSSNSTASLESPCYPPLSAPGSETASPGWKISPTPRISRAYKTS